MISTEESQTFPTQAENEDIQECQHTPRYFTKSSDIQDDVKDFPLKLPDPVVIQDSCPAETLNISVPSSSSVLEMSIVQVYPPEDRVSDSAVHFIQDGGACPHLQDPIEGRDSEFDLELSSRSSVHSMSIASSENDSDEETTASEPEGSEDGDSHEGLLNHGASTHQARFHHNGHDQNPSIYGKVVKSLQKSFKKIFHYHQNHPKLVKPTIESTSLPNNSETPDEVSVGPPNGEIPYTRILTSPITSVAPGVTVTSPTIPPNVHHKTLLIDVSYSKPLLDAPRPENSNKKCLVLDLDETLVHSSFQPVPNADIVFPVHFGEGVYQPIYVCKRPGVDDFLNAVCDLFEVVIFTASLATYADPVINFLDPHGKISYRLYRDSCLQFQGIYLKDLSRLGRDLEGTIIIDNSPASYSLQPRNGLGCRSWFSDPTDRELNDRLLPLLKHLACAASVSAWRLTHTSTIEKPY